MRDSKPRDLTCSLPRVLTLSGRAGGDGPHTSHRSCGELHGFCTWPRRTLPYACSMCTTGGALMYRTNGHPKYTLLLPNIARIRKYIPPSVKDGGVFLTCDPNVSQLYRDMINPPEGQRFRIPSFCSVRPTDPSELCEGPFPPQGAMAAARPDYSSRRAPRRRLPAFPPHCPPPTAPFPPSRRPPSPCPGAAGRRPAVRSAPPAWRLRVCVCVHV